MKPEELVQALRRCSCQAESRGCEACPLYSNNDCVTYALSGAADLIERLRELAAADKDGRVVVLPCKVGDVVWFTYSAFNWADKPIEAMVLSITISGGTNLIYTTRTINGGIQRKFTPRKIGKTVFLTRKEAERALEEQKNV